MSERDDLHEEMIDAIMNLDVSQMPEWFAKKIRIAQSRPDLMWLLEDSDDEIARKTAEFNELMLAGEAKH